MGTGTKSVGSNLSCSPHVQCLVSDSAEAAQAARGGQAPPGGGDCESEEAEEPEARVHRGQVTGLVDEGEDQAGDRSGDAGHSQDDRHNNAEGDRPRASSVARGRTNQAPSPVAGDPSDHDDEPRVHSEGIPEAPQEEDVRLGQGKHPPDHTGDRDNDSA